MKVQVNRAFTRLFLSPKNKQVLHEISFNLQYKCAEMLMSIANAISKLSAPFSTAPSFSKNAPTLRNRINKLANEHTVDYHPIPSELTSRIHPLVLLWTPKGFISPEYFFVISSNLYIPPWL